MNKLFAILIVIGLSPQVSASTYPTYSPSEIMARNTDWEIYVKLTDDYSKIEFITLKIFDAEVNLPIDRIRALPEPNLGRLQVLAINYNSVETLTGEEMSNSYRLEIPYDYVHYCEYVSDGNKVVDELNNKLVIVVNNKAEIVEINESNANDYCKFLQNGF